MQGSAQRLPACACEALKNGGNGWFQIRPEEGCALQRAGDAAELVAWRSSSASPGGEERVTSGTVLPSPWLGLILLLGSGEHFLCLARRRLHLEV